MFFWLDQKDWRDFTEYEAAESMGVTTNEIEPNQVTIYKQGQALAKQWSMIGGEIMQATIEFMREGTPFSSAEALSRAIEIAASANPIGLVEYQRRAGTGANPTGNNRSYSAR